MRASGQSLPGGCVGEARHNARDGRRKESAEIDSQGASTPDRETLDKEEPPATTAK